MSEDDNGSSESTTSNTGHEDVTVTETVEAPKPARSRNSKSKGNQGQPMKCDNNCGFMTRYANKQALQDKKGKPAKTEDGKYICPMCQRNGISGTLSPCP